MGISTTINAGKTTIYTGPALKSDVQDSAKSDRDSGKQKLFAVGRKFSGTERIVYAQHVCNERCILQLIKIRVFSEMEVACCLSIAILAAGNSSDCVILKRHPVIANHFVSWSDEKQSS